MGANGPGWVRRGSHGYNRVYLHGEARKQGEMGGKPAIRTYFAGVVTGKKTTRSWQAWSRGSERIQGGIMAEQRVRGATWLSMSKSKAKKQTTPPEKNENEHVQIDVTRWFTQQKKQS